MNSRTPSYRRHRFPPQIISHAVWLYHRFSLSFRDVEDLLAQRGVEVSYESVRRWCEKFGPDYAARAKRRQPQLGDTWHLDEIFVKIAGRRQYLWRWPRIVTKTSSRWQTSPSRPCRRLSRAA